LTQLTLARADDLDRLSRLVGDCHAERGIDQTEEGRRAALAPLMEGSPHGAVYLIGPGRAPIGYVVLVFGWSLAQGGLTGTVEEIYIRPGVRQRGIGSEVLTSLPKALAGAGLIALHAEPDRGDERAHRFFSRLRFVPGPGSERMTRAL